MRMIKGYNFLSKTSYVGNILGSMYNYATINTDPVFSNAKGFYREGLRLWGN